MALVSRISSSPRGLPWAAAVSVLCGEGQPMWLRNRIIDGLSSTAMARRDRRLEGVGVVGDLADVVGVPAVGVEALGHDVGVGELGGAVDGDVVVVVDVDEPAQAEVPGERRRLVADPFHEVAVTADDEGVMVDERRGRSAPAASARPCPCRRRCRRPGRAVRW